MGSELSVGEVLARLEAQMAALREEEAVHARQEEHHRAERERCAGELARLTSYHQAFQEASEAAVATAAQAKREDEDAGAKPQISRLAERVVESLAPGTRFAASWVTQEIDRRFGRQLHRRTDPRHVAVALRRLVQRGQVQVAQKGRPHWETQYYRP